MILQSSTCFALISVSDSSDQFLVGPLGHFLITKYTGALFSIICSTKSALINFLFSLKYHRYLNQKIAKNMMCFLLLQSTNL